MGEVGTDISEKSEDCALINGDVNGICDQEQMEVDVEENSQISSENGNTQETKTIFKTDLLISRTESLCTKESPSLNADATGEIANDENSQKSTVSSSNNENTENGSIKTAEVEKSEVCTATISTPQNKSIVEEPLKTNGNVNGPITSKDSDEVQIIESDDEDVPKKSENKGTSESSELVISRVEQNVISNQVNFPANGNIVDNKKPSNNIQDDDGAVIIHSDSEGETNTENESQKTTEPIINNTKSDNTSIDASKNINTVNKAKEDDEVQEILSDKDDCVVIEDDEKKDKDVSYRRGNRQRKSVMKVRDFSVFDDDITEIVDEGQTGQPPVKRQKTGQGSPMMQSANLPQVGQITIKDARTLMAQFPDNGTKQGFQQQFVQASGGKGTKEPTLVIIDTNSIIKTGSPQANLPNVMKQNAQFSVLPVNLPAQGVYPVNIRPALAPMSSPPKLVPTTAPVNTASTIPLSNPTLLPALTDDMFVLEAPSFIVPYIYEKPPSENLREVVAKMGAELEALKKDQQEKGIKECTEVKHEGESSEAKPTEKKRKKKKEKNPDDSWDETDESTDEDASDSETRTKVLIKEAKTDLEVIKNHIVAPERINDSLTTSSDEKKSDNYFESPLGKFFIDIGIGLVQEYVQADLLRQQRRRRDRSQGKNIGEIERAITALKKNLEDSKKRNEAFKFEMKRCEFCNFKSESALVMAHHYETPHMRQYMYKCNFCTYETRPAHDILFHMEAVHNIKGRLEKAPSYHQCPNCPFEDNGKSKLARHAPVCAKKFRPEGNLLPPHDWEAPAKIPRIKPRHGLVGTATAYQAMAAQAAAQKAALASMQQRGMTPNNNNNNNNNNNALMRNRGRPQTVTRPAPGGGTILRSPVPIRPQMPGMPLPNNYQIAGGQLIQVAGSSLAILPNSHSSLTLQQTQNNTKKQTGQQPSISITPLPRQPGGIPNPAPISATTLATATKPPGGLKPGQNPSGNKTSFVICEICDGYIKDLEQLRNHMQWMHKVKIHPKMIYNRPPLNCQKCQYRFFTDQGLERHLLGSHGLVTSSMQEAANKGKDAGRCPVCGRMYQWKLLNHVSRDHHMTLKPAHLSYKCTVCTATFGMYKQFENHVYTAHSTVAKKAMDSKKNSGNNSNNINSNNITNMCGNINMSGTSNRAGASLSSGDSLLKPLKINDEITIIPQPASKSRGPANEFESHVID